MASTRPGVVCSRDDHGACLLSRPQFWCFSFESISVKAQNDSWLINLFQHLFAAIVTMCFMIKKLTREFVFPWITCGSSRPPTLCATAPSPSTGSWVRLPAWGLLGLLDNKQSSARTRMWGEKVVKWSCMKQYQSSSSQGLASPKQASPHFIVLGFNQKHPSAIVDLGSAGMCTWCFLKRNWQEN